MSGRGVAQLVVPAMVIVVTWFGLAWLPAVLSGHDDRRIAAEEERGLLIVDLAEARTLPSQLVGLEARLAETQIAVPATVELAEFVRATDVAADRAGIAVEQMAPLTVSSDTDEEALTSLPVDTSSVSISIGARGGYDQVLGFADELLAMGRLVVIDLMDLTTDEEDASQIILDLELRIFTTQQLVTASDLDAGLFDEEFDEDGELIEEAGA